MPFFGAYSRYYNLFYRNKDYAGEAAYVNGLIKKHHPGAKSLLDLGCGTGRHAFLLAEMGFKVTGVDRSEEMLAVARSDLLRLSTKPLTLNFFKGDLSDRYQHRWARRLLEPLAVLTITVPV